MKARKILIKALSGSKSIRFQEFTYLIEALGFVLERITGSHRLFKHPDVPDLLSVQPTKDSKAKSYQVRQLIKLIEEYSLSLDENGDDVDEVEE
jgi:predicted RNA binding protein YcfA (HicA-like mRNA interferase family)